MLLSTSPIQAQIANAKTETYKINGNCGMCKTNIEKAGNIKSISKVVWNKDSKTATITFNSKKTNADSILKRIATAGYDNEKFKSKDVDYENLHGCCQYEREDAKTIEQKEIVSEEKPSANFESVTFVKMGEDMPNISLNNNLNKQIALNTFKNKWVLIDFWASWCKPCRVANKSMVKLYAETNRKDFEVIAISIDEDKTQWQKAIQADKLKYTQLIDPKGFEAKSAMKFDVEVIPSSFLFNPQGKLVSKNPTESEIKNFINSK